MVRHRRSPPSPCLLHDRGQFPVLFAPNWPRSSFGPVKPTRTATGTATIAANNAGGGKGGVFVGLNEPMRHARRRMLVVVAVLAAPLAGCGSSGSSGSPGPAASSSQVAANGTASAATASSFVGIVEPFDPGHPARAESAPASCAGQSTAVEI